MLPRIIQQCQCTRAGKKKPHVSRKYSGKCTARTMLGSGSFWSVAILRRDTARERRARYVLVGVALLLVCACVGMYVVGSGFWMSMSNAT